jgi:hypothetical protein
MKSGFTFPMSVAIDDEDDIVGMVDNEDHCVHMIDLRTNDLNIILTLGEKGLEGNRNDQFSNPVFVAFVSIPQKRGLYVSDSQNNRIQYYNRISRGKYEYGVTISIPGKYKPCGISINNHIIAVAVVKSKSQSQINIYETVTNRYIKSVGSTMNMRIIESILLPINTNDNNHDQYVIVADKGNDRILIISIENDSIMHSLGSTKGDGDDQFNHPSDIAIDTTYDPNILAVSDYYNHSIKYYSLLNYQYITRMGTGKRGLRLGEFSRPIGIDISDKYMVVSEGGGIGNKRIQLFRRK